MQDEFIKATDAMAMFCRLQMNIKKDLPVRSSEMGVLIFIQKQDEPVTPLMISNFFQITKPSVTVMINELLKKEYLEKMPSSTDKRSYTVSMTNRGRQLVESTHNEYFKTMELLKLKMGQKDFDLLISLINKANRILGEEMN